MIARQNTGHGRRLIFVGGAARSGTTLVQNILDSHPQICGGPVFVHAQQFMQLRNQMHDSVACGFINLFCSRQEVDSAFARAIEQLLLPLADRFACEYLSEKTTANIMVFPELAEVLPEARFVWVLRDPRAIVSSILQVGRRAWASHRPAPAFTCNLDRAIEHLRKRLLAGYRAADKLPSRLHVVKYEHLVTHPETVIRQLCDFLRVPYSADMLQPSKQRHPGEQVIANTIWYQDLQQYYRDPEPTGINRWQQQLTRLEQTRIATAFAGDRRLEALGYKIPLSTGQRMLSAVSSAAAVAGHACHRLASALTPERVRRRGIVDSARGEFETPVAYHIARPGQPT